MWLTDTGEQSMAEDASADVLHPGVGLVVLWP